MRGDAIFIPSTVDGYEPETIDSWELGFKSAFLDRKLFINAAAFYSDYKDQQVTVQAVQATVQASLPTGVVLPLPGQQPGPSIAEVALE